MIITQFHYERIGWREDESKPATANCFCKINQGEVLKTGRKPVRITAHGLDAGTGGVTTMVENRSLTRQAGVVNGPALLRRSFGPKFDKATWTGRSLSVVWFYYLILHVKKPWPWEEAQFPWVHCSWCRQFPSHRTCLQVLSILINISYKSI